MVEQAQAGKAGIQRLADRICAVFVPAVLACAALTLAGWLLAGSPAGHAVSAALAVLIIACPCALGLATPAALVVASGRGAQLGIFIKGYQALESSRAIDTVVLDKTGTVTTGQMTVTAVQAVPGTSRADLLRYAGSVEQASEHAVAAAITALARAEAPLGPAGTAARRCARYLRPPTASPRCPAWAPAASWTAARSSSAGPGCSPTAACRSPRTWPPGAAPGSRRAAPRCWSAWDDEVRGAFAVTDTVKPSAAAAVARLRGLGLRPVLLTGDNAATARPWPRPPGSTRSSARRCPRPRPG